MSITCSYPGCPQPIKCRGMCANHYKKWREDPGNWPLIRGRGKWFNPDGSRMTCFKPECTNLVETQGLCLAHYQEFYYASKTGPKPHKRKKRTATDGSKISYPCSFPGCPYDEVNKGLCHGHDGQRRKGRDLTPVNGHHQCPVDGCNNAVNSNKSRSGLCAKHSGRMSYYSLTPEAYVSLFDGQKCGNPGCSITGIDNLCVDHDHACCAGSRSCGKCVRGVLCKRCNQGLGLLKEDPERIQGILRYLGL